MKNSIIPFMLFVIIFCSGCSSNKTIKHWTKVRFDKADHYHDLNGKEVSQFKFGQELNYFDNFPYTVTDNNGVKHAYMTKTNIEFDIENGFWQQLPTSTGIPISATTDSVNILYLRQEHSLKYLEHVITSTIENDSFVFSIVISGDQDISNYEKSKYQIYQDKNNILTEYFDNIQDQIIQLVFHKNKPSVGSLVFEGVPDVFTSNDEYLKRYNIPADAIFLLEEDIINKSQFLDYHKSFYKYGLFQYTNEGKNYAVLYTKNREGIIDHSQFISKLNESIDNKISPTDTLCLLYAENHKANESFFGIKGTMYQNFDQLTCKFPQYRFLTVLDKDLHFRSKKMLRFGTSKKATDHHSIIDQYISLFEMEAINWIVVFPDGRTRIHYGYYGDFIKMIELLKTS